MDENNDFHAKNGRFGQSQLILRRLFKIGPVLPVAVKNDHNVVRTRIVGRHLVALHANVKLDIK